MQHGIEVGRDDANNAFVHADKLLVLGDVAGADDLDAALGEATINNLTHQWAGSRAGHEQEDRVRLGVCRALQEGREVRVGQRRL